MKLWLWAFSGAVAGVIADDLFRAAHLRWAAWLLIVLLTVTSLLITRARSRRS
jgi:hypothetical protein